MARNGRHLRFRCVVINELHMGLPGTDGAAGAMSRHISAFFCAETCAREGPGEYSRRGALLHQ
eukprot:8193576-Karenia_brevis.AAC.1